MIISGGMVKSNDSDLGMTGWTHANRRQNRKTIASGKMRPCAFLFAASRQGEDRGESLDEVFLSALKAVDPQGKTVTRVYRGGILIHGLSYKPSSIKTEPVERRKRGNSVMYQTSRMGCSDRGVYATLVGDFVETCLEQWNTLDQSSFWDYVANRALDATFVPSLSAPIAQRMDKSLCSHPRYIGAVSPDLGNPLHRYLFVEMMFKDAFIRNGRVNVCAGFEGQYDGLFFGADTFTSQGLSVLSHEKFEKIAPTADLPDSLSARGLVTEMRMQRRMAQNIHEKVMSALDSSNSFRDIDRSFVWDLSQLPDSPEEVDVQARKLTDYLLNLEHEKGASKAQFFERELGITCDDWAYLHGQLIDCLGGVA